MTHAQVLGTLIWKRPGEAFNVRDNPNGVTMADVVWHAPTTPPTNGELTAWVADYITQKIAAQQEVDAEVEGKKILKALVIWLAGKLNMTPAAAKAEILAIYKTL